MNEHQRAPAADERAAVGPRRRGTVAAGAVLLAALPMDWIEEVFGVEPDGGNGLFEFAPIVVLAVAAVVLCLRVARVRRRPDVSAADVT